MTEASIRTAARWIQEARSLIITAGAGIGVDSGLPDFRGSEGFWRAYPALKQDGIGFYDIATPAAFHARPQQAWGFYGHRLALYRKTVPHAGFHILREMAQAMPEGCRVFTSNVDGQFQRAGFDPASVHECHGSIHMLQCLDNCNGEVWSASGFDPVVDDRHCLLTSAPPRCPDCGALARPHILMFDDNTWVHGPTSVDRDRLDAWWKGREGCLVIEIGAGEAVPTVRRFGERVGSKLIRINMRDEAVKGPHHIGLRGSALAVLSALSFAMKA
ncbi:SIR2 family NAD-dependent protein deacylase [Ralstonia pseudosolanacearum]|uniref:SIR2 family NAD-dependent protein deacylase n=1 Tax=Ralstonia pseudosolanacearum TaxID=1310165 RepID=UPI0008F80713|nr:Sir2 family NAD-dependent protein deacetylase [Ralstonia pseudosolanacearum]AVV68265.1 NAD-dependent deacetylase [Ralstonia solanacearum OE1-1]NKA09935.1 NAD-dependent deacetylase [Ralstonia solanacearum]API75630.1 NAD-dependent deacetylase [Ralstonia pseudosolanacearum]OIN69981.1 NAD-dependent deacetylase [Ralstonia solanacearum]QWF60356.1 NAD-dependent deacetylase [Ralstonia solanacearum]